MFLFTSFILPLDNILSHSKVGASVTITTLIEIASVRGEATITVASTFFSFEEYEKFGGGSYTSDLLSHLLKLSTQGKNIKEKQGFESPKREQCVTKKKKLLSFSFAIATTLDEPLLSIPFINDGYNDKNKDCSNDSNNLSNVCIKMNDIFLITSLLFRLHQESFTLVSSQCISIFV